MENIETFDIIMIGAIVFLFLIIAMAVAKQIRDKKMTKAERLAKAEGAAVKRYQFLSTFFLTQSRISAIAGALSALSVYKQGQIAVMATRMFLVGFIMQASIIMIGAFLFRDIFAIMTCSVIALFVGHITVDREIEKINIRVYKEMSYLISQVRQEYLKTGSIPEALVSIVPSPLMVRAVAEIEDILTCTDGEERLLKFYESSPFRMLQTFATVCYNINNTGDEIDADSGHSRFLDSLTLMASDINNEVQRLTLIWQKFSGLVYLPLIPLVGTPIVQMFLRSSMPGTAAIFDGMLGFICNFIVLLLTGLIFYIVSSMCKSTIVAEDDRIPQVVRLWESRPNLRTFIFKVSPKNAARRKCERNLDEALSRKTPELLTLERILFLGIGLIVGTLLLIVSLAAGRNFLLNSTQNFGIIADESLNSFQQDFILEFDNEYLNRDYEWSDEELLNKIKQRFPGISDMSAGEQMKRLRDKEAALNATNMQWWYIWIVAAFAVLMAFVPKLLLVMRKWSAQAAAEEDFLQLQSLMTIVMCMGVDTIDALEQLCTNTRIHRPMLLYAYHSYPANPEKELERLRMKVTLTDFKRFVDKLKLTIVDLSLAEAFSDLIMEREHLIRMREMAMLESINRRRALAGMLAQLPLGAMVVLQMLLPIVYLGINEFTGAMSGLSGL